MAQSGTAAPEGGNYDSFGQRIVEFNSSGQVVYTARGVTDVEAASVDGVGPGTPPGDM